MLNGKILEGFRAFRKEITNLSKKYNEQTELFGHIPYFKFPDVGDYIKLPFGDYFIKRILISQ